MSCPNCGGTMEGDGCTSPRVCENADWDDYCDQTPDCGPIYCRPLAYEYTMDEFEGAVYDLLGDKAYAAIADLNVYHKCQAVSMSMMLCECPRDSDAATIVRTTAYNLMRGNGTHNLK